MNSEVTAAMMIEHSGLGLTSTQNPLRLSPMTPPAASPASLCSPLHFEGNQPPDKPPERKGKILRLLKGIGKGFQIAGQFIIAPKKTLRVQVENRLLFHPSKGNVSTANLFHQDLKSVIEEVTFPSKDSKNKIQLHGWYVPAQDDKPTLLLAHGNAGDISNREWMIKPFTDKGYGFLAFDYRGYGNSEGEPSETGFYQDFDGASDFLKNQKGIPLNQQVAMGESIGGAVAIDAASRTAFRGLYVFSSFTSVPHMAIGIKKQIPIIRLLPDGLLKRIVQQKFNSIEKIGSVQAPLTVAHGTKDGLIPFAMGKTLLEQAEKSPYRQFISIEGGDHNDLFVGSPEWTNQLTRGLDEMLSKTPVPA